MAIIRWKRFDIEIMGGINLDPITDELIVLGAGTLRIITDPSNFAVIRLLNYGSVSQIKQGYSHSLGIQICHPGWFTLSPGPRNPLSWDVDMDVVTGGFACPEGGLIDPNPYIEFGPLSDFRIFDIFAACTRVPSETECGMCENCITGNCVPISCPPGQSCNPITDLCEPISVGGGGTSSKTMLIIGGVLLGTLGVILLIGRKKRKDKRK